MARKQIMNSGTEAGPGPEHGTTRRSRWPIIAGFGLALVALACAILVSLLHLRQNIFTQIANRDGERLAEVAAVQFAEDKANDESVTTLADPSEQIQLALKLSSRLHSVLGVRLFSPEGKFLTACPAYITETALPKNDLVELRTLHPVSHFAARAALTQEDALAENTGPSVPLLVVNVPLREDGTNELEGIAQFLVHGASIANEYAVLDRHLVTQGVAVFMISGCIVGAGLFLAFSQVQRANRLLAQRTNNLLKANRELALAAKTSAIGAVTSHLIHGLRNPLSGLRTFVQDRAQGQDFGSEDDWRLAAASAQRMQALIDRVVRVLQEQQTVAEYEITLHELVDMLNSKLQPAAQAAGVQYRTELQASGTTSNRQADLILLILENLLQNAIEATPPRRTVTLRVNRNAEHLVFEVEDQGAGLRSDLLDRLFAPCASGKKGGSGIGLAISRQLAVHLGARLDLKHSSSKGCCFVLLLPSSTVAESNSPEATLESIASLALPNSENSRSL